jgi:hypothetical protein
MVVKPGSVDGVIKHGVDVVNGEAVSVVLGQYKSSI